jgi:hypothetical protein
MNRLMDGGGQRKQTSAPLAPVFSINDSDKIVNWGAHEIFIVKKEKENLAYCQYRPQYLARL